MVPSVGGGAVIVSGFMVKFFPCGFVRPFLAELFLGGGPFPGDDPPGVRITLEKTPYEAPSLLI
jgi:hypothetical protein